jgi:hypothetical protein
MKKTTLSLFIAAGIIILSVITTAGLKRKKTQKPSVPTKPEINKKKTTGTKHKRCIAITKKGTQCKNTAEPGSDYCWQHRK